MHYGVDVAKYGFCFDFSIRIIEALRRQVVPNKGQAQGLWWQRRRAALL